MDAPQDGVVGLAVALGAGLLIGIERERRKGLGDDRQAAGLRSFAVVAATGGSTNAALHLPALANEIGIAFDLFDAELLAVVAGHLRRRGRAVEQRQEGGAEEQAGGHAGAPAEARAEAEASFHLRGPPGRARSHSAIVASAKIGIIQST